jgi:hypothetical protein
MVSSVKRAVITKSGFCEWYEMCLCPTPLRHERATQYDLYFTNDVPGEYHYELKPTPTNLPQPFVMRKKN